MVDMIRSLKYFMLTSLSLIIGACSVNPATGERQFTAFMSPEQEVRIGAQEHDKIIQLFGGEVDNDGVKDYVRRIGEKLVPYTEREEVEYKFFVLDSPVINAFALPGGYVYVTRGLVGLANSEAELASVVGHEIGHITARHSAERYSQGVLASLGTTLLSEVVGQPGVRDVAQLGSQLYLTSYSRSQESEADRLGLRYISGPGYDNLAAARFLYSLDRHSKLQAKIRGKENDDGFSFLATHPKTEDRVKEAKKIALSSPQDKSLEGRIKHLQEIKGMIYGHSPRHGFTDGQTFIHPGLGFLFELPPGFEIINNPNEILAISQDQGTIIFDSDSSKGGVDPKTYLTRIWMAREELDNFEIININGKAAASGSFDSFIRGRRSTVRVVAVQWNKDLFYRFMMAMPQNASDDLKMAYQRALYSLRSLTAQDKKTLRPRRFEIITARPGDTIETLSQRQAFTGDSKTFSKDWFYVLNGLEPGSTLKTGMEYKIIVR